MRPTNETNHDWVIAPIDWNRDWVRIRGVSLSFLVFIASFASVHFCLFYFSAAIVSFQLRDIVFFAALGVCNSRTSCVSSCSFYWPIEAVSQFNSVLLLAHGGGNRTKSIARALTCRHLAAFEPIYFGRQYLRLEPMRATIFIQISDFGKWSFWYCVLFTLFIWFISRRLWSFDMQIPLTAINTPTNCKSKPSALFILQNKYSLGITVSVVVCLAVFVYQAYLANSDSLTQAHDTQYQREKKNSCFCFTTS